MLRGGFDRPRQMIGPRFGQSEFFARGKNNCYHSGTWRIQMATVEKISIALPPDMITALRKAVESGEYASSSEVIREALRDWKLKRKVESLEIDELRRLVQEGIDSGPGIDGELVFSRLREKYRQRSDRDSE